MITSRRFEVTVKPRVLDNGWTDTWFYKQELAGVANVSNVNVSSRRFGAEKAPFRGIDVLMDLKESTESLITIIADDPIYDRIVRTYDLLAGDFDHKNLLLAVLSLLPLECLTGYSLTIRIMSIIPPGASMGTSAAVAVGLVKCFNQVLEAFGLNPILDNEIALLCWRAETEVMDGQSGIQDQKAAVEGKGFNLIVVEKFPQSSLEQIMAPVGFDLLFQQLLLTVHVGQHDSSESHLRVIKEEQADPDRVQSILGEISHIAQLMADSYRNGNVISVGDLMKRNTDCQFSLNPELVGEHHQRVISLADDSGALGWKVNGAGGEGGTVTLLFDTRASAANYYRKAKSYFAGLDYLYFEHQIA